LTTVAERCDTAIAIGNMTVGVRASDASFVRMLRDRYAGFIASPGTADFEFEIDLTQPADTAADDDVRVFLEEGRWHLARGDFRAEWDPAARRGRIRQSANPYSLDTVLRIVHTLVLAREGGFLAHAASVVRNGRAFLFAGASGAGKTTLSRLAPPDAAILSDEVSYVRREIGGYHAYGTPFAGELARSGENVKAPLAAVYLLEHGQENRIDAVGAADAARGLLANILFFAEDAPLVRAVFRSALDFVGRVPVRRLTFMPDARVWELIR
jgi:hypothetical protein